MRDPREALAHIRARADAASEGPWEVKPYEGRTKPETLEKFTRGAADSVIGPDAVEVVNQLGCDHCDEGLEMTPADAEFIAAARTDVPALVDALEGVLALHRVINVPGAGGRIYEVCQDCNQPYPCRYAATIADALNGTCPAPNPEEDA